jgi:acyl dehydratase
MIVDQKLFIEDVQVGQTAPESRHGPLTLVDTIRWCGFQENWWASLHYDRDRVRTRSGLRSFIASGAYREALVARMITDWIGPRGMLRRLSVRHVASTLEGDFQIYTMTVVEKSEDPKDSQVTCEIEGRNQEDKQILTGRCTVTLPARK